MEALVTAYKFGRALTLLAVPTLSVQSRRARLQRLPERASCISRRCCCGGGRGGRAADAADARLMLVWKEADDAS